MADPELERARTAAIGRAHDRISDIVPIGLDHGQLARLSHVLFQVWDDGYGHGRDDEADGQPTEPSEEDRIRGAMAEAKDHPGRVVTR
jgi:hypothetical protein